MLHTYNSMISASVSFENSFPTSVNIWLCYLFGNFCTSFIFSSILLLLFHFCSVLITLYIYNDTHAIIMCLYNAGNHVVLMIGFAEFRAGIRTRRV